mgnify:FL=1
MTAAAKILERLHNVHRTHPQSWAAGCPCCESRRGRPVSVRETDDGRALLHAFCGCATADVLGKLGLTLSDLFDRPLAHHYAPRKTAIPARDLLSVVSDDVTVIAIEGARWLDARSLDEESWTRVAAAVSRITWTAGHAN